MPNNPDYRCTRCNRPTSRENLCVKRVQFTAMGEGACTLRSRVVEWLCVLCMVDDKDYNRDRFQPPRIELSNA